MRALPWRTRLPDRPWFWSAAILLLALACRLPWALQERTIRWDEPDHLILARNLLRGAGYQVFGTPELTWPPVTPALSAVALAAGVPAELPLALWHVLAGAALAVLLYRLAREVTGEERVARLAGALAALWPSLVVWPLYWGSLTESLFLAFLLAGLWALWRLLHCPTWRAAAAAGAALCLAYLTRPEGLIWWALFGVILAALTWRRGRGWREIVIYAGVFVLLALPYWGFLHHHTGRFILSGKTGITAALGVRITEQGSGLGNDYAAALDSTGTEIMWLSPERFEISLLQVVAADPRAALARLRLNLSRFATQLVDPLLGLTPLALLALGLVDRLWDRQRARGEAFWLATLIPLAVVPLFHSQARLYVPLLPAALVWVARGAWRLADWGRELAAAWPARRSLGRAWAVCIIGGLLVLGAAGQVAAARAARVDQAPTHEAAGRWLAANTPATTAIMSRDSEVAFYAGRRPVAFPDATWEQALAYGRARSADYLVVDDWELQHLRPQFGALADPTTAPPGVVHVRTFSGAGRTTLVYRLDG